MASPTIRSGSSIPFAARSAARRPAIAPDAPAGRCVSARGTRNRFDERHGAARDRGFSMMEALAVIAVIAILATLALPSYLDKIIRDQVVEALPLADIAKGPIAAAWASSQPLPTDNAAAELPSPDKIVSYVVSGVTVRAGAIDI